MLIGNSFKLGLCLTGQPLYLLLVVGLLLASALGEVLLQSLHLVFEGAQLLLVFAVAVLESFGVLFLDLFDLVEVCLFLLQRQLIELNLHPLLELVLCSELFLKLLSGGVQIVATLLLGLSYFGSELPDLRPQLFNLLNVPRVRRLVLLRVLSHFLADGGELGLQGYTFAFRHLERRFLLIQIALHVFALGKFAVERDQSCFHSLDFDITVAHSELQLLHFFLQTADTIVAVGRGCGGGLPTRTDHGARHVA